ncbi:hypothetical protein [Clostridium sp. FP1]|uniref:hypothetical protein n=1 Tax=Clostridium sp. FP1 TaxID=2724076 RepID=UPI0013E8FDD8|nr:hypothetical protein [Clostridium sp. FP1]MBZ9635561.1 hypothetical protein [Clostridium sp. FP1]
MGLFNKIFNKYIAKNKINLKYNIVFTIDYLNIDYDEKLKNAKIIFPLDSNQIIINGDSMYFNALSIDEAGRSEDDLYRKIYTRNFAFWITPCDYNAILYIMKDREKKYQLEKQNNKIRIKATYSEEFEYDKIDDDIYRCCIVDKGDTDLGNINCGGSIKDFKNIENYISDICKEHGGRYYKTQSKNTKFVIIFGCNARLASRVKYFRNKGYKVTSFENVLKYLSIANLWDINKMKNETIRIKETIALM